MAFPSDTWAADSPTPTAGVNHVITLPAFGAGDRVVVPFHVDNDGGPTVTWPSAANWADLVDLVYSSGATSGRIIVKYRDMDGSANDPGAAITITTSGNRESAGMAVKLLAATYGAIFAAATQGTSATPDPPNLDPTGGAVDTLWIALAGDVIAASGGGAFSGFPASYADNQVNIDTGGSAGIQTARATRDLNAGSEDPGTFTIATSQPWGAVTIGVLAAAEGTGLSPLVRKAHHPRVDRPRPSRFVRAVATRHAHIGRQR